MHIQKIQLILLSILIFSYAEEENQYVPSYFYPSIKKFSSNPFFVIETDELTTPSSVTKTQTILPKATATAKKRVPLNTGNKNVDKLLAI